MRWDDLEIDKVLRLLKLGKTYSEISNLCGRSESSIRNKMNEIGEKSSVYKTNISYCINCTKEFSKKDYKFCSKSCSVIFNNKNRGKKKENVKCLNCDKDGIGKKYCSNKCQGLYKRNNIFKKIEDGDITLYEKNYKNYLIYKFGEKCMKCEWSEKHQITGKVPIQMEHKDGNSYNNSLDNLELLCPNCHSLTLTYGSLNKGKGRKNRKR